MTKDHTSSQGDSMERTCVSQIWYSCSSYHEDHDILVTQKQSWESDCPRQSLSRGKHTQTPTKSKPLQTTWLIRLPFSDRVQNSQGAE